jgi:hypothetical protein
MTRYVAAMICLCLAACGALYLSHESGTELEQHAHEPPGPWTEDTNALVRRVSDRYASELRE